MSSVFLGTGLGLFESSLTQLNGYGSSGNGRIGRGQDEALVNAGTGNLILRSQDEFLASIGLDSSMVRTYNSQGQTDGDNNDGWRISAYRSLVIGSGTNPITRTGGDGHATTFTWDAGQSAWISSEGAGANDRIQLVASQYQYIEGGTGVVETYDATGKLLSLQDGNGNTLTYGYTGALITSITDQKGQKVLLTYTGNNLSDIRVLGLVPGATATTQTQTLIRVRYTYDGLNRLASTTVELTANNTSATFDTNVYITTYAYDGTSTRVSKVKQNYGSASATSELAIQYVQINGQYRVWTLTDALGRTTEFSYDTTARKTLVTDPLGNVTTYTYDTSGRLTRVDLPRLNGSASNIQYGYDTSSNITQVTDAAGRVVKYTYNGRSNLTQILDSLGNTVTRTYGTDDRLLSETTYTTPAPAAFAAGSPAGPLTTNYVYDALGKGNLRYLITAEGRVTEYKYDVQGEMTSVIRYLGGTYTVASGLAESNLDTWVSGQDKTKTQRTDSAYDLSGQIKSVTRWNTTNSSGIGVSDGLQSVQRFIYDVSGRLLISGPATLL
ncbi:MAG: hypothetical protein Q8Q73_10490 [Stagnimonas sp.]|nr:hypothetical protein [Stagnimonas sp.]